MNNKSLYLCTAQESESLSPAAYLSTILRSFLTDFNTSISYVDADYALLSLEDRPSALLSEHSITDENRDRFFERRKSKKTHIVLHDSVFLENSFASEVVNKYASESLSLKENSHVSFSSPWEEIAHQRSCPLLHYPWIPEEAVQNIAIGRLGKDNSEKHTTEKNNRILLPARPIVIHMRGVREGRLHIIVAVLKELSLLDKTVLLIDSHRVAEFRKFLALLEAEEMLLYSPETLFEIKVLFNNAICFLNPLFSSLRPLSHLLMEAFNQKTPVLLADFGPVGMLPSVVRKYSFGKNEKDLLAKFLTDALEDSFDSSPEEVLYDYAQEFGNPHHIAFELKKILTENGLKQERP